MWKVNKEKCLRKVAAKVHSATSPVPGSEQYFGHVSNLMYFLPSFWVSVDFRPTAMHGDSDEALSRATEQSFSFGEPPHVPFLSAASVSDVRPESQDHKCGIGLVRKPDRPQKCVSGHLIHLATFSNNGRRNRGLFGFRFFHSRLLWSTGSVIHWVDVCGQSDPEQILSRWSC